MSELGDLPWALRQTSPNSHDGQWSTGLFLAQCSGGLQGFPGSKRNESGKTQKNLRLRAQLIKIIAKHIIFLHIPDSCLTSVYCLNPRGQGGPAEWSQNIPNINQGTAVAAGWHCWARQSRASPESNDSADIEGSMNSWSYPAW